MQEPVAVSSTVDRHHNVDEDESLPYYILHRTGDDDSTIALLICIGRAYIR